MILHNYDLPHLSSLLYIKQVYLTGFGIPRFSYHTNSLSKRSVDDYSHRNMP